MSYCRLSPESDLYVYHSDDGNFVVYATGGTTFRCPTADEAADKVDELAALGYRVPGDVVDDLRNGVEW